MNDKEIIKAKIEGLITAYDKVCAGNMDFLKRSYPEKYYAIPICKELLSFIDSL